jgi:hypothetical protein
MYLDCSRSKLPLNMAGCEFRTVYEIAPFLGLLSPLFNNAKLPSLSEGFYLSFFEPERRKRWGFVTNPYMDRGQRFLTIPYFPAPNLPTIEAVPLAMT